MVYIGCDPAFRQNGFCIAILDENRELQTKTFKKFIDFIGWVQNEMPQKSIVAIENSYLQNSTFDMSGPKPVVARKSRNVGKNQAVSQIAYELFTEYAAKVHNVSPKGKGRKRDNAFIMGIIKRQGWKVSKKRFNPDERDAIFMLNFAY